MVAPKSACYSEWAFAINCTLGRVLRCRFDCRGGVMRQSAIVWLAVVVSLALIPAAASAQGTSAASIAGVVRDTSGAVLPGVTVDAASPALIEKVRTTVTDGDGQYRIIELRPGTYSVTFSLPGFRQMKRDGLELTPNFTATVNGELSVGSLEETITVSGESPLVDTQNVTQQKAITNAVLDAVPTPKSMIGLATLMPAATQAASTQDVGGSRGESSTRISVHGGRPDDAAMMLDGMSFNRVAAPNGRGMNINPLAAEQILIDSGAGGSAEYTSSAAVINVVPKDGSNQFKGTLFLSGMNNSMQADNLTDELKAQGMRTPGKMYAIYDVNVVVGGPIITDKLWFSSSHRRWGRDEQIGNLFADANLGIRTFGAAASAWRYAPDFSKPTRAREDQRADNIRLTWQAAATHKFTFCTIGSTTTPPTTSVRSAPAPRRLKPSLPGATSTTLSSPPGPTRRGTNSFSRPASVGCSMWATISRVPVSVRRTIFRSRTRRPA